MSGNKPLMTNGYTAKQLYTQCPTINILYMNIKYNEMNKTHRLWMELWQQTVLAWANQQSNKVARNVCRVHLHENDGMLLATRLKMRQWLRGTYVKLMLISADFSALPESWLSVMELLSHDRALLSAQPLYTAHHFLFKSLFKCNRNDHEVITIGL